MNSYAGTLNPSALQGLQTFLLNDSAFLYMSIGAKSEQGFEASSKSS
ncbi:hypothetical protein KR51_00030190 [Rubidibacter lacunae KORDI 51-2]|uniref:Uncharacterized protein n=1 Tax=Rubidibacter lacunae KORDI 51-2 TaxID=582515 RepID=U5DIQ3_9CHRO|nr:hypothetical protein KR51_00030190 [Rubidibacter lacunae KORDI 51-2]